MHSCYDKEKDTLTFTKVDSFFRNKVYYHGCLKSFLEITKWNGPEVIYFGDHLFSDLRGPSKAGWRTAAIIHELESEIQIQNKDDYRFEQVFYSFLGIRYQCFLKCDEYAIISSLFFGHVLFSEAFSLYLHLINNS